ncbi:MAG: hypothetical protein IT308_13535 [Anaerolineaceae bacterium]|nr:hypothetical protein [Anaerolineaceae bacterium]
MFNRALSRVFTAVILAGLLFSLPGGPAGVVRAAEYPPSAPSGSSGRETVLTIDVDLYEWWLTRWNSNEIVCRVVVEHEGLPKSAEIYEACEADVYEEWYDTQPCSMTDPEAGFEQCTGLYLYAAGEGRGQKQVKVELPPLDVTLTVTGCILEPPYNRCESAPNLKISGFEPLPNEAIIRVQGMLGAQTFSCPGAVCDIPLAPTGTQGVPLEFWADSSFGDSSAHYTAMLRVIPWGDFMAPEGRRQEGKLWYVDVLSSQWRGPRMASCASTWESFPGLGGPPGWLTTPKEPSGLQSSISYYYLAGMLIQNGVVDASGCPGNGLQADKTAGTCGVQAALPKVLEWQNRFDSEIIQAARDTGVPGQLLKNIFGRESQLWPGIYYSYKEAGLGQMTELGADAVLLWNPSFYQQFCPLVLGKETCALGFGNLKEGEQNLLRGALVQHVNAACPSCPEGIDLTQVNFSVHVFAEGLAGNCEQAGQIIRNSTLRSPGQVSSYPDLWRFTLVNYNAGPGCLAEAIAQTWNTGYRLTWDNVSGNLQGACRGAINYVNDIGQVAGATATPTPWLMVGTPRPPGEPGGMPPSDLPSPDGTQAATPTPPLRTPVVPYP